VDVVIKTDKSKSQHLTQKTKNKKQTKKQKTKKISKKNIKKIWNTKKDGNKPDKFFDKDDTQVNQKKMINSFFWFFVVIRISFNEDDTR